jgi:hypothetical protein
VAVISIATTSTAATSSASTTIVTTLNSSAAYSVGMTVLSQAIVSRFAAIVDAACIAVTESCNGSATCKPSMIACNRLKTSKMKTMNDIPSSEPEKPPRRPPRPPLPPLCAGSVGASFGASRFPERALGLSTVFGGGEGSRSESWSLVLPKTMIRMLLEPVVHDEIHPVGRMDSMCKGVSIGISIGISGQGAENSQ